MDERVPAGGDGERVAFQIARRAGHATGAASNTSTRMELSAPLPDVAVTTWPARHSVPVSRQLRHLGGGRIAARIDDGADGNAGAGKRRRRAPAAVIVGEDDEVVADRDAIAARIGERRAGEHDARRVVAGEDEGPFERAGRKHDVLRLDPPMPLPGLRAALRRDLLHRAEDVVVVIAVDRDARELADVGELVQRGIGAEEPVAGGLLADLVLKVERAAERRAFLAEDDARAGLARGKRRREAGRAAAHDEHVAEGVGGLVAVGVGGEARLAEAGGAADERLVEHPRPAEGADEGLVVEARREERREPAVDRAEIALQRRPGVLAA